MARAARQSRRSRDALRRPDGALIASIALVACALAACGRLSFEPRNDVIDDARPGDDAPDAMLTPGNCNSMSRVADDFAALGLEDLWAGSYSQGNSMPVVSNGHLVMRGPTDLVGAQSYRTFRYYDMRDAMLVISVVALADPVTAGIDLNYDDANYVALRYKSGTLDAHWRLNGVYDELVQLPYDTAITHWAFRETRGTLEWLVSTDGGNVFVPFHTEPTPFDFSLVRAGITATTEATIPAPGTATFDAIAAIDLDASHTTAACKIATLRDTFDTDVRHRWASWYANTCCDATVANGKLALTSDGKVGYVGYRSAAGYDMRDGEIVVEVAAFPRSSSSEYFAVELEAGASNQVGLLVGKGGTIARLTANGVDQNNNFGLPAGTRFVRIREGGGQLRYEVSPDRAAWSTLQAIPTPAFSFEDMIVVVNMGASSATTAETTTIEAINE